MNNRTRYKYICKLIIELTRYRRTQSVNTLMMMMGVGKRTRIATKASGNVKKITSCKPNAKQGERKGIQSINIEEICIFPGKIPQISKFHKYFVSCV